MPLDKDLKDAHKVLYDDRDALKALQKYDTILKSHPDCVNALLYKAASLEKLYYGSFDWHNDQSLQNAKALLDKALVLAQTKGDRSRIGLVYFRYFVHHFNNKEYKVAKEYMENCEKYGFQDGTLPMWKAQLEKKLKKLMKKDPGSLTKEKNEKTINIQSQELSSPENIFLAQTTLEKPKNELKANSNNAEARKFKTDWYQTSTTVVLSLFTSNLPKDKADVKLALSKRDNKRLEVNYPIVGSESEFQFSVTLAQEVLPEDIKIHVFSKKIEITLIKKEKRQWKYLESQDPGSKQAVLANTEDDNDPNPFSYPSSSAKNIDWSKVDLGDEEVENSGSADAFFQQIYANADPDTQRAMMKSFVESNGTTLNTNWEDVSKKYVKPAPPEGTSLKNW